ncbi:hypothetical protein ACOME3_002909 [Neoechinorhynchus agilis]
MKRIYCLLYRLDTNLYYQNAASTGFGKWSNEDDNSNWPPFRRVGTFNPFSTNDTYSIKCICGDNSIRTCRVLIGTSNSYVFLFELSGQPRTINPLNLLTVIPNPCDSSESRLIDGDLKLNAGYQACHIIHMAEDEVSAVCLFDYVMVMACPFAFTITDLSRASFSIELIRFSSTLSEMNDESSGDERRSRSVRSMKSTLRSSFRRRFKLNAADTPDRHLNPGSRTMLSFASSAGRSLASSAAKYLMPISTSATTSVTTMHETNQVGCNTSVIIHIVQLSSSQRQQQDVDYDSNLILIGHQSTVQVYSTHKHTSSCRFHRTLKFKGTCQQRITHISNLQLEKTSLSRHTGTIFKRNWLEPTSIRSHTQKPYLIICSNQQIKLISLASMTSFKTISKCRVPGTSGHIFKAAVVEHSNSKSLCLLMNSGTIARVSLPSLKILQKASIIEPSNNFPLRSTTFLKSSSRLLVQISPGEFKELRIEVEANNAASINFNDSSNDGDKRLVIASGLQRMRRNRMTGKNKTQNSDRNIWRMIWSPYKSSSRVSAEHAVQASEKREVFLIQRRRTIIKMQLGVNFNDKYEMWHEPNIVHEKGQPRITDILILEPLKGKILATAHHEMNENLGEEMMRFKEAKYE